MEGHESMKSSYRCLYDNGLKSVFYWLLSVYSTYFYLRMIYRKNSSGSVHCFQSIINNRWKTAQKCCWSLWSMASDHIFNHEKCTILHSVIIVNEIESAHKEIYWVYRTYRIESHILHILLINGLVDKYFDGHLEIVCKIPWFHPFRLSSALGYNERTYGNLRAWYLG